MSSSGVHMGASNTVKSQMASRASGACGRTASPVSGSLSANKQGGDQSSCVGHLLKLLLVLVKRHEASVCVSSQPRKTLIVILIQGFCRAFIIPSAVGRTIWEDGVEIV